MNNTPFRSIRRTVNESVATLSKLLKPAQLERPDNRRSLRFECLEERRVLSADGLDGCDHSQDSGYVTTDFEEPDLDIQQQDVIQSLKVSVNGQEHVLTPGNNRLELVAGDKLEVVEIAFESGATEGVYAAEGYINKINGLSSASLIDYEDGRFSGSERDYQANGEDGVVAGLADEWIVESGWDRLTISLMHYAEESVDVDGRFQINLQVGQPDFAFDTDYLDKVTELEITEGDEVKIPAKWANGLAGNFHNYAEVDIYHEFKPNVIVWAGASVGNASSGNTIEGQFVSTRQGEGFSEHWTPDRPGEYTLKYYLDPEHVVNESNEDNNVYEIRLTVNAKAAPVAIDDEVADDDTSHIDVLENDLPTHAAETIYEDGFESESLTWSANPNGTDTATSGTWEATDPVGTAWNGVSLQQEDAAEGTQAFVTGGQDDGSVGEHDVDGGVTSALSELIAVPADANANLSFQYSFAHLHNSSSDDYFRVTVVGENQLTVVLEERGSASARAGEWTEFSISLSEFAGQDVQILIEAADQGTVSLVEAGIDAIKVEIPETPMDINEFTQPEHGSVALNEDGTFNYTPAEGFSGEDHFQYNLTDGGNVSNSATVTVQVEAIKFLMPATASGDEDSSIALNIETDYDKVTLSGVPADAVLSHGKSLGDGVFKVKAKHLGKLTVTPASNSDVDFKLTVTPERDGVSLDSLAKSIDVVVKAVVDGGELQVRDFGILTGNAGAFPHVKNFTDLDGSESHEIKFRLPDFVTLSAGTSDGNTWTLSVDDMEGLTISADRTENLEGWSPYHGVYDYRSFEIDFSLESFEQNSQDSLVANDSFNLLVWQRR